MLHLTNLNYSIQKNYVGMIKITTRLLYVSILVVIYIYIKIMQGIFTFDKKKYIFTPNRHHIACNDFCTDVFQYKFKVKVF